MPQVFISNDKIVTFNQCGPIQTYRKSASPPCHCFEQRLMPRIRLPKDWKIQSDPRPEQLEKAGRRRVQPGEPIGPPAPMPGVPAGGQAENAKAQGNEAKTRT